jgi:hypothetical protein
MRAIAKASVVNQDVEGRDTVRPGHGAVEPQTMQDQISKFKGLFPDDSRPVVIPMQMRRSGRRGRFQQGRG